MNTKINKRTIISFALNKNKIIVIIVIHHEYDTNICKMKCCHAIIIIINKIDLIINVIEALVVIFIIIHKKSLLDIIYDTLQVLALTLIFQFNTHSNTADLHVFYLTINNINNFHRIIRIINTTITIIVQMDAIHIGFILISTSNIILIGKLDTKMHKGRIIWFVLNKNKIIVIVIIHHDTFDTNICKMIIYYHVIINIINKRGTIINGIDAMVQNNCYAIEWCVV